MSLKVRFDNKSFSLMMTHNKKIRKIMTAFNFISIISLIFFMLFVLLLFISKNLSLEEALIPLFLAIFIITMIPPYVTKDKDSGYQLTFIILYLFALIFTLLIGRALNLVNPFITSVNLVSVSFIFHTLILKDFLYISLAGFLISFGLTFLTWGFSVTRNVKDFLVSGFLILGATLFFLYVRGSFVSYISLIYFVAVSMLVSIGVSSIEPRELKGNFAFPVFTITVPVLLLAGLPMKSLISPLQLQTGYNVVTTATGALTLLIVIWLSSVMAESLVLQFRDKLKYSLLLNIAIGIAVSAVFFFSYGGSMYSLLNTYLFFSSISNIVYFAVLYFILTFIILLVIALVFGTRKIKIDALSVGLIFIVISSLLEGSGRLFFTPSPLIFGSAIMIETAATYSFSRNISGRFFKGKSILDRQETPVAASSNDIQRPPLCWVKSGALEGYSVRSIIGVKSGFGYVLDAYDPSSRLRVAIKVLKEASDDGTPIAFDSDTLNKFNEEHAKLKNLKGVKNIVSILDTHLPEIERYKGINRLEAYIKSPPYIVMEFLTGGSLSDAYDIFTKREYIRSLLLIINGVSEGLYEAHSKGIVHGDIKPDNILFSSIGRYTFKNESVDPDRLEKALLRGYIVPKLTDFGTAKVMTAGRTTFSTATIHYAPPEILVNQNIVDQRYDIYELGLVMYYELAGVANSAEKALAFNKRQTELSKLINQGKFFDSINDVISVLESRSLEDLRKINPGVSERLSMFIARSIEPNPAKRPKSMKDFSNAIKAIAAGDYNLQEIRNL